MSYDDVIGSVDLAEIEGESARLSNENVGNSNLDKFLKLPQEDCKVLVRILPPRKGEPLYVKTRIHYVNNRSYYCPKMFNTKSERWEGDCPICDYYNQLWKWAKEARENGNVRKADELEDSARAIKPIDRCYFNVIVRQMKNPQTGDKEVNVGPKIWAVGKKQLQKIFSGILGDRSLGIPGFGEVWNYKTGRDFMIIKKSVKGANGGSYPDYSQSAFIDPSPLGTPEQIEQWIHEMENLNNIRTVVSNQELKDQVAIYCGLKKDSTASFDMDSFAKEYGANDVSYNRETPRTDYSEVRDMDSVVETPVTKPSDSKVVLSQDEDAHVCEDDFMDRMKEVLG